MTRHYIKDSDGKDSRDSAGRRQFWSDTDGDSDPKHDQTTYSESKSFWGGSMKNETRFDPSSGSHEDSGSGSGGGCFLTTACAKARNLADDCHELAVLRAFRDDLSTNKRGRDLVAEYYAKAPLIVAAVERDVRAAAIWDQVFVTIQRVVGLIERGERRTALSVYRRLTMRLWREVVLR